MLALLNERFSNGHDHAFGNHRFDRIDRTEADQAVRDQERHMGKCHLFSVSFVHVALRSRSSHENQPSVTMKKYSVYFTHIKNDFKSYHG